MGSLDLRFGWQFWPPTRVAVLASDCDWQSETGPPTWIAVVASDSDAKSGSPARMGPGAVSTTESHGQRLVSTAQRPLHAAPCGRYAQANYQNACQYIHQYAPNTI